MTKGAKLEEEVKVLFHLDPEDEQDFATEVLITELVAPGQYRLKNSPLFAFGLSVGDVIEAKMDAGALTFAGVASRGGHSTYRLYLQDDRTVYDEEFLERWPAIHALGATFESANGRFAVVDIAAGKDVEAIYDLLEEGEDAGVWGFEEVHYEPADGGETTPD